MFPIQILCESYQQSDLIPESTGGNKERTPCYLHIHKLEVCICEMCKIHMRCVCVKRVCVLVRCVYAIQRDVNMLMAFFNQLLGVRQDEKPLCPAV